MNLDNNNLPDHPNNDSLGTEKVTESIENENMTDSSETVEKLVNDVFNSADMFPTSQDENVVELTQEDYNIMMNSLFEYKSMIDQQAKVITKLKGSIDILNKKIKELSGVIDQRVAEENKDIIVESFETIDTTEIVKNDRQQLFKQLKENPTS